jgi:hypothetical protein
MKIGGLAKLFVGLALILTIGGCGGMDQAKTKPQAVGADVFTEVSDNQSPPRGSVDLIVKASFKTPTREHYLLKSRTPPSAEDGYPFELNIDGQEIVWKMEGRLEETPVSGERGRLPEGGEGIRYRLDKKVRLMPGFHHVVFGLSYENYYTEVKVSLKEGEPHTLEFVPVYAMGRRGYRTFFRGIRTYSSYLDGVRIR